MEIRTTQTQKEYCLRGTLNVIAISNRDVSNAQVTTWQTNATEKKDLVMSDVSSTAEIILRITRVCTVYKDLQKKTYPPLRWKIYNPPGQIKQTVYA
jgi:hypothetical protein